ncbi:MAG: hypothetical protein JWO80_3149 [Bryobacterales bacterium]|nr:hypothetical protein [Bryobacterales bacterium]
MAGPGGLKNREIMIEGMFSAATRPSLRAKILKTMLAAPEATAVGALNATLKATREADNSVLTFPTLAIYADHWREGLPLYAPCQVSIW